MSRSRTDAAGPFTLDTGAWERLERRVDRALALVGRGGGRAVASVTVAIAATLDLSAAVLGARSPGDHCFCFEQPARAAHAVCSLGAAAVLQDSGPGRAGRVAQACRELGMRTFADGSAGQPPATGPIFCGGLSFAPAGGGSPQWAGFAAAQFVLPEVSLVRQSDQARMTVNVAVDGHEPAEPVLDRLRERLATLRPTDSPLLDPDPISRPQVAGAAPPSHFEEAVRRAVERIRAGELEKVVLAREVHVQAGADIDPAPVHAALRAAFPECYCYLVGAPGATFLGASPELLVRRNGARAQTVALAGTTRRSADPAVDDHLGEQLRQSPKNRIEQDIVARRIQRALEPLSLWVGGADEPALVKVQNVQHLATPIRAQLASPVSALELADRLHPTPAVGGEPAAVAEQLIPALEGIDRGWYAGAVGWTDLAEDGELCVALRCALLRGSLARLYSGCGIVADSVPAQELAESEDKLQALLPLLA